MEFDSSSPQPRYINKHANSDEDDVNDQLAIEQGVKIRLKIVGTRVDATEIFAIGSCLTLHVHVCKAHTKGCLEQARSRKTIWVLKLKHNDLLAS